MQYNTTRFGSIDVPDDKIINFDSGVIGFENEKKFVILKHRPESSFFWLQSLATPDLAFSMLFPFEFVPSYKPELTQSDLKKLGCSSQNALEIYAMVVIPKDLSQLTINLLSPVAVNPGTKLGIQAVLIDSDYKVSHPLVQGSGQKAG